MYEILTTFRPCVSSDDDLIRTNPILLEIPEGFELRIFNQPSDLPEDSRYIKNLVPGFEKDRPTFCDYINEAKSNVFVLANSDVLLPKRVSDVMSIVADISFGVAATTRYDVPSDFLFNASLDEKIINSFFKRQSLRTIDCFVINKNSMKDVEECTPGTVGFDNLLLSHCYRKGLKVVDFSRYAEVYHCHHEHFRIPFRTNLILSASDQNKFSFSRKASYKQQWYGGCLSQADYKITKNGVVEKCNKNTKIIRYKMESLRIRAVNLYEKALFRLNEKSWKFACFLQRFVYKKINIKLCGFFGGFIVCPRINIRRNIMNNESLVQQSFEVVVADLAGQKIRTIAHRYD